MSAHAHSQSKKAPGAAAYDWSDEIAALSRPLALFLAAMTAALLVLGGAGWYKDGQMAALAQAQQIRDGANERFHNVETERQEVAVYQPRFLQLQAGGMVGDENRLLWIESVGNIQRSGKLISASYEIEPQQLLTMAGLMPMALGDYQLRGSRMRLQLGLVHELDLFNFIDELRGAGKFSVQQCKVKRTDVPAGSVGVARLLADCTVIWLTLGAAPLAIAAPTMKEWP